MQVQRMSKQTNGVLEETLAVARLQSSSCLIFIIEWIVFTLAKKATMNHYKTLNKTVTLLTFN